MTYITTVEFHRLTAENLASRLKQAELVSRSLNQKINSNKRKHLVVENELKKWKTFYWSYCRGKNNLEEDGTQNYLVFQPIYRYFKRLSVVGIGNYIYFWKSKGCSDENISVPNASD